MFSKLAVKYPIAMIALTVIVSAFGSTSVKIINESIPIFTVAAIRWMAVGTIIGALSHKSFNHIHRKQAKDIIIQATLQMVLGLAWFGALTFTKATNSSITFLLVPIMIYVGSVFFLKEPRSSRVLAGSLVALVGGFLLFGTPAFGGGDSKELIGNGLLLVTVVSWSALALHGKRVITDENINAILSIRFISVGVVAAVLALLFEELPSVDSISLASALWLAIFIFIIGVFSNLVFYRALVHVQAEEISTLLYLDPLIGVISGVLILGETMSGAGLLASGVIVAGVLISHPVHVNRMLYYRRTSHSNFEEFLRWARQEYESMHSLMKKYF